MKSVKSRELNRLYKYLILSRYIKWCMTKILPYSHQLKLKATKREIVHNFKEPAWRSVVFCRERPIPHRLSLSVWEVKLMKFFRWKLEAFFETHFFFSFRFSKYICLSLSGKKFFLLIIKTSFSRDTTLPED